MQSFNNLLNQPNLRNILIAVALMVGLYLVFTVAKGYLPGYSAKGHEYTVEAMTQSPSSETNAVNNQTKPKIVNYHASWCGFCQKFKPVWKQFAERMGNKNIDVISIQCDLEENKELCQARGIRGFPTVKLYSQNGEHDFDGDRTVGSLQKFCEPFM